MKPPDIPNLVKDAGRNITFRVMAYGKISRAELLSCVSSYYRSNPRDLLRTKRSKHVTVTIPTLFGIQ